MRTTNVVRIAFLIVAFLAHASPSHAYYYPDWQEDCDSHCIPGGKMVHECDFWDMSGAPSLDASSVCDLWECGFYVTCTEVTEPEQHYAAECYSAAEAVGQGPSMWFNMQCSLNGGASEGSFYCSYNDSACP